MSDNLLPTIHHEHDCPARDAGVCDCHVPRTKPTANKSVSGITVESLKELLFPGLMNSIPKQQKLASIAIPMAEKIIEQAQVIADNDLAFNHSSEVVEKQEGTIETLKSDNLRLFDMVRHQRHELLNADLLSMDEFASLMTDDRSTESVARLENYDTLRKRIKALEDALRPLHRAEGELVRDAWDDEDSLLVKIPGVNGCPDGYFIVDLTVGDIRRAAEVLKGEK